MSSFATTVVGIWKKQNDKTWIFSNLRFLGTFRAACFHYIIQTTELVKTNHIIGIIACKCCRR